MAGNGYVGSTNILNMILSSTFVPSLDEREFRRTGDTWRYESDATVRIIEVQTLEGHGPFAPPKFTINVGVSYLSLGEAAPDPLAGASGCRHHDRIGRLLPDRRDTWWELPESGNSSAVERVTAEFNEAWTAHALTALDAWENPGAMRDHLDAASGFTLLQSAELSLALHEVDAAQRSIRAYLDEMQTDAHLEQLGPGQPPSAAGLTRFYLAALPLLAPAEMTLTRADVVRARMAASAAVDTRRYASTGEQLTAQLEGLAASGEIEEGSLRQGRRGSEGGGSHSVSTWAARVAGPVPHRSSGQGREPGDPDDEGTHPVIERPGRPSGTASP